MSARVSQIIHSVSNTLSVVWTFENLHVLESDQKVAACPACTTHQSHYFKVNRKGHYNYTPETLSMDFRSEENGKGENQTDFLLLG